MTQKNSNFLSTLEQKLIPLANIVSKNRYLLTLRDTFAAIMPLLIVGSFFTLVGSFPITAWTDFLDATVVGGQTLSDLISIPSTITVSMMALFVAFLMGYNFAAHNNLSDRVAAGLCTLGTWLLLMPLYTSFTPDGMEEVYQVSSIPMDWLGSKGVFVAIVAGFLSCLLYGFFVHKDLTIKMPEGVPPTVSRAFSSLIPLSLTFLVVWVVRVLFLLTSWGDVFTFIYTILQIPLQNVGGTVFAQAFVYLFAHILWFFGIHGTSITSTVYKPILLSLSALNLEAVEAGLEATNIINYQFQSFFAVMGGAGSTLSLLLAILIFCKSERLRKLAKLSIAPGIFNINEPIVFGLPIVLNPVMLVPFIGVVLFNIFSSWAVMAIGLVPICSGITLPWTTPAILSGFLVSGWQGAVWQVVLNIIGMLIYLPFVKTLDKQYLSEQMSGKAEGSSEIDSVDLNLDF